MAFPSTPGLCCHHHLAPNLFVDADGHASASTDLASPTTDRAPRGRGVDGGLVAPCFATDREVVDGCDADVGGGRADGGHADGGQVDGGRADADADRVDGGRIEAPYG